MKIIAKQQGIGGEVMEMVWAKSTDEVGAMLSVAQLFQHAKDEAPWSPKILEIRIEL